MSTHIEFRGSYFRSTQPIHENTNFAPGKNFPLYIMVIDHRVSIYSFQTDNDTNTIIGYMYVLGVCHHGWLGGIDN